MWKCHKCGKPVYFAERKMSMGYDWHPECLRCEECGKRLNPGQHAEHRGVPYCNVPCYSVLFGPTLFGHGSRVEAHTSFGKIENRQSTPVPKAHLEAKLRIFNQFFDGKSGTVRSRERNGKLILEGSLRIYWGVNNVIHLKEDNDDRMPVRRRNSYRMSNNNNNGGMFPDSPKSPDNLFPSETLLNQLNKCQDGYSTLPIKLRMNSFSEGSNSSSDSRRFNEDDLEKSYKTLSMGDLKYLRSLSLEDSSPDNDKEFIEMHNFENVPLRRKKPGRSKVRRRCSINGHFYNRETSVFTPTFGSVTSVWVTSLVNTPEVINMLLSKFKVENNPEDFVLYILRDNGERRFVGEEEYPLLVRVLLGPNEDVAKVFIGNKTQTIEISNEVAQYLNFAKVELETFLQKFHEEEDREVEKIKEKYMETRKRIVMRMDDLRKIKVDQS